MADKKVPQQVGVRWRRFASRDEFRPCDSRLIFHFHMNVLQVEVPKGE